MLRPADDDVLPGNETFLRFEFHHTIVVEMPENCNHFNRAAIGSSGGLKQVYISRKNQCAYLLLAAAFDDEAAAFQRHNKLFPRYTVGTADDP